MSEVKKDSSLMGIAGENLSNGDVQASETQFAIGGMQFNGLCPAEAERLFLLLEELGEAQQAIGKVLRHGYPSCWPDGANHDNRDDLAKELGHVAYAVKLMCRCGDLNLADIEISEMVKGQTISPFLHHQFTAILEVPTAPSDNQTTTSTQNLKTANQKVSKSVKE